MSDHDQNIKIRVMGGVVFILAIGILTSISNIVFMVEDVNRTILSTDTCHYLWQLILTDIILKLVCIIPLSFLLSPLKITNKTMILTLFFISILLSCFSGPILFLSKIEICSDAFGNRLYLSYLFSFITSIMIPGFIIIISLIIWLIQTCRCRCNCSCDGCFECWEKYKKCCNKCVGKSDYDNPSDI